MPAKVVFIGLDSADPELLQKWGQDGKLPNIRRLQQSSAWGAPLSPPGLGSGAMWPSLCTDRSRPLRSSACSRTLVPDRGQPMTKTGSVGGDEDTRRETGRAARGELLRIRQMRRRTR